MKKQKTFTTDITKVIGGAMGFFEITKEVTGQSKIIGFGKSQSINNITFRELYEFHVRYDMTR